MNRMQKSIQRHYDRLLESATVAVVYSRSGDSVTMNVITGTTPVKVEDSSGLSLRSKRRDWIIRAIDLVLAGQTITPEVGDQIRITNGNTTSVYEVQRLAGEDCYYGIDDMDTYLRVHTNLTDTEAA